jgi:mono/diheme cytochrome c family protein
VFRIAAVPLAFASLSWCQSQAQAKAGLAETAITLLAHRCAGCHGAKVQMGGLRLDSRDSLLRGGQEGAVVTPGTPERSRLLDLVAGKVEKKVMPPVGGRLAAAEVESLREWIAAGVEWPAAMVAGRSAGHWSFQPIRKAATPAVEYKAWIRNEIDAFVLRRLEEEGWKPAGEAERRTLIRRVALDLTGLPPSSAEVEEFVNDTRSGAYERLVDRLLASPHYGERWATHWLDLARYADSDGYEKDNFRPNAWRWRHWVIEAFNRDKPFDQFTREQLAGDLIPNANAEQILGTGFHRNTLTNREGGVNIEQFRTEQVLDRAATTATVWLGLSGGCAQCHDHKYDPIAQRDFYRLAALFNNADEAEIDAPLPGEREGYEARETQYRVKREQLLAQAGVAPLQAQWETDMREARANPGKRTDWDHAYDALQKYLDHADEILSLEPAQRSQKQRDALTDHFVINYHRVISKERNKELRYSDLRKALNDLREAHPALSEAPVLAERRADRRSTHVLIRGEWKKRGEAVEAGLPGFLDSQGAGAAMNRLEFANWIVSAANPLTARVMANRYWQEFFGRGLVRTAEDFGSQGEKPTHPELLDWLAARFMEDGWSVKRFHRLIVTSAAYRQDSTTRAEIAAKDPENRLLARQNRLRLGAEFIRDSALAVSGLLDRRIGGRSVRPPIPKGVVDLSYAGQVKWNESSGGDRYRRGLYVVFQRTVPFPMLVNFDHPDASVPACRRERSTTPLQALNLLNDATFVEAARALAWRTEAAGERRIEKIFAEALGRPPSADERRWASQYLERERGRYDANEGLRKAWGVENGERASWILLASALLNLDEFITRE